MDNLFSLIEKKLNTSPRPNKIGRFVVDEMVGLPPFCDYLSNSQNKPILIVVSNLYKAQKIYSFLCALLPQKKIHLFLNDELIHADIIASNKDFIANRIFVLNEIVNNNVDIVIANLSGASRFLPEEQLFKSHCIKFKIGQRYDFSQIKKILVENGYSIVNKIDQSMQFAIRGDIIDIFSVNFDNPVRIEFFDDEIESIRYFDIATQRSIKKVEEISILPGNDFIFENNEKSWFLDKIRSNLNDFKENHAPEIYEKLLINVNNDIDDIINHNYTIASYKYYSFFQTHKTTLLNYCKDFEIVFSSVDSLEQNMDILINESFEYLYEQSSKGRLPIGLEMFNDIRPYLKSKNVWKTSEFIQDKNDVVFNINNVNIGARKMSDIPDIISSLINDEYKIYLCVSSASELKIIEEILTAKNITYEQVFDFDFTSKQVGIQVVLLPYGFILRDEKIIYLSPKELFNTKNTGSRYTSKFKEGTILKSFEDLNPGDYVVHEYQGIAQFDSLVTLSVENQQKDFLKLLFKNNEVYYVPLSQFQLVRKYMGKEGYRPRLSKLHSNDWEKQKQKIKEKINDLAQRLVNLYVERSKIKGFAFEKDSEFQTQFENDFEYELTPDQQKALIEIKNDMESESPMDRLLCGDVGFGKTELAFRAAFKAILSGKQVVILCPTTLLARQHFERALPRFKPYGVRLAQLSRLVAPKQLQTYIDDINNGRIDLIIGTHKILSKKIHFPRLGLLIIDEEQRFGVEQKELLKEIKNNIDVLTLSATPIPRTLQISLIGVRSLSTINTPPSERLPIQTFVLPYNKAVIKELIERELGRGGQVFYLHNEIESIYQAVSRVAKLVPNASIGVGHGKMDKTELEDVMNKFYAGEIDILICTSIIENGIDIPNANMIIVENADKYGLSQLYQIKGRVGRSDRIAYAYLTYNEFKELNDNAKKRLKTLQEFTEFGSGYRIAQRDLLIRGAGDILGPEQAGFIDSIGLDMYLKLLNESVQSKLTHETKEEEIKPNANLSIDAYIPDTYASGSDKIELYQEILSCENEKQLENISQRIEDIYGKIPEPVHLLFIKKKIDINIDSAHVEKFVEYPKYIEGELSHDYLSIKNIGNLLFESMVPYLGFIKLSYVNNRFTIRVNKRKKWTDDILAILKSLANIYNIDKEEICD